MDKDSRNAIERFAQKARRILEEDFSSQLEAAFDISPSRALPESPGAHLDAVRKSDFSRIIASMTHKESSGMPSAEAVSDYVRDSAFTTLNRFVALKMLEERDLILQTISRGTDSSGYSEFCMLAEGLKILPNGQGYRLYLECVFDELSSEIKVLFDRRDSASVLWPSHNAFEQLLGFLNDPSLEGVWGQEETIGWVYQFFNSGDERKKMRKESQAPRNSRELAVRNQFFTPDYVVRFLTDNTLGRIWFEMMEGRTALASSCEYMVNRPQDTFAPRKKKDPRDIRVLDPACGSGHFLLYAFGMLQTIYEEAWVEQWRVVSGQWTGGSGQQAVDSKKQQESSGQKSVDSGQQSVDSEEQIEENGRRTDGGGWTSACEKLQGPCRLAEGDGSGRTGLLCDKGLPEGRALRADVTASPGGGIGSIEHCRGTGPEHDQGLPQPSLDSLRFAPGSGDTEPAVASAGLSAPGEPANHPGNDFGSRPLDQRSVILALEKAGYSYSLTSTSLTTDHSSLTTDHSSHITDHRPLSTSSSSSLPTDHCPLTTSFSPLLTDFPTKESLRKALPGLILRHNLHGVDIDPRCAQIAQLALWMRAQKAYQDFGILRSERPAIRRSNIVIAEPMPGEQDILAEFVGTLGNPTLEARFRSIAQSMNLAGDLGLLLRLEKHVQSEKDYQMDVFEPGDDAIRNSLEAFLTGATVRQQARKRLFTEDAVQGLGLVELAEKRYDVVLMNPPFGAGSLRAKKEFEKAYPRTKNDVYAAFVERGIQLLHPRGRLGAITSRTGFFLSSFQKWREEIILKEAPPVVFADLGYGVLDSAMVETAAYCLEVKA